MISRNPYAPNIIDESPLNRLISRISNSIRKWFSEIFRKKNHDNVTYTDDDSSGLFYNV
jgi:hypothetical protein